MRAGLSRELSLSRNPALARILTAMRPRSILPLILSSLPLSSIAAAPEYRPRRGGFLDLIEFLSSLK